MADRLYKGPREFPWEFTRQREVTFFPTAPPAGARLGGDILEIGPGHGHLLAAMAEANPDKRFLAIELDDKRCGKVIDKLIRRNLTNVTLIRGFAQTVIPIWIEMNSFERVYIMFPDPWPKNRHVFHRMLNSDFLAMTASLLKVGGELLTATDFDAYAEQIIKAAGQVPALENQGKPFCSVEQIAEYVPTVFEQKWRSKGMHINYMKFIRGEAPIAFPLKADSRQ